MLREGDIQAAIAKVKKGLAASCSPAMGIASHRWQVCQFITPK